MADQGMGNLPADPVAVTAQEAGFPESVPGYPDPLEPGHEVPAQQFCMDFRHRT